MKTIIKQSETFRRALKFTHVMTGETIDLSGCTAFAQMRVEPGGELLAEAVCDIDTNHGVVSATWSKEQTATFPVGKAGYDIWLRSGDEQKPIFEEEVIIKQGYTEIGG